MICLFEKDETSFTGNGIAVLRPTVCTVAETAGGSYTLRMEHPFDENGIYSMVADERIIRAPVPPTHIPAFTMPETVVWQTTAATSLWSSVPYTRRIQCAEDIKRVKQNPDAYRWNQNTIYNTGTPVAYGAYIYRAKTYNVYVTPGTNANVWEYVTTIAGSGDTIEYIAGTKIEDLAAGTTISKIADYYGIFIQAKAPSGNIGYIAAEDCEETQTTESGETVGPIDITEQLFRIYKIEYEDDRQVVVAEARHISYDFQGNALRECTVADAAPMTAVAILRGSLLDEDGRTILTNIEGKTISADWSWLNPVNVLLDPDNGIVPNLGAALIRNNGDFYLLDNSNPRKGIRIAYGKNLLGVKWSQSSEEVITRVMPRCGDGNGGTLLLDDLYVESDISSRYTVQRTETMNCGYSVGDTIEKADGSSETMTEATAKAQMEADARKRFEIDQADKLQVSLEVNFLLIGDTEEYRQYRGLETVCLYDEIEVVTGKSGMTATAQVTEYEYDSIRRRYKSIRVGDIRSMRRRIPGYRIGNGAITYDKLGNDVIMKIRSGQGGE